MELRVDLFLTRWAKITHFAVIKRFIVSVGARRFKNDVLRFNRKFTIAGFCVLSTFFLILFSHLEFNHALQDTLLESNVFHSHLVHHLNVLLEKSVEVIRETSAAAAHDVFLTFLQFLLVVLGKSNDFTLEHNAVHRDIFLVEFKLRCD